MRGLICVFVERSWWKVRFIHVSAHNYVLHMHETCNELFKRACAKYLTNTCIIIVMNPNRWERKILRIINPSCKGGIKCIREQPKSGSACAFEHLICTLELILGSACCWVHLPISNYTRCHSRMCLLLSSEKKKTKKKKNIIFLKWIACQIRKCKHQAFETFIHFYF